MSRATGILWGAAVGAVAGVIGSGAMVVGERVEQAVTGRPDSYVPARALLTMLGKPVGDRAKPAGWNRVMHYGTGAALGALRGVWAVTGIRGRSADAWHTVVRLGVDQTIENATGVGAPPSSWPRQELVVDVLHKTVFSFVTGRIADAALAPLLASARGRRSH